MQIILKQEVGSPGKKEAPKTIARLEFMKDSDFPDALFANRDEIQLLDGDTIKLTACYRTDNKNLVVAITHAAKGVFSSSCAWDEVNPVFRVAVKKECEISVLCEK